MDAKLAWWDKLAKAGVKKDKDTNADARSEEGERSGTGEAPATRPGVVAVRGPEYRGSGFDDASTYPGDGRDVGRLGDHEGGTGDGDSNEAPLHVDSYLVRESLTDDEIRQRILAGTTRAEVVDKIDPSDQPPWRHGRSMAVGFLAVVVVVIAITVGVTVSLSNRTSSGATAQQHDEHVVASYKYLAWQGSGGFANAIFAETRDTAGTLVTSGAEELIHCRPRACKESDRSCVVDYKIYEPGCCAGAECPNETKCGQVCPQPPASCYLTDSANTTCHRSECYTCAQENGDDVYILTDYAFSIDCLEAGTAIRPDNGLEYKWVIFCGPVIVGPIPAENRDLGKYQCEAARLGANFSDDDGGLLAFTTPCQFIALAECGCGPSDMYTFGLPEPTGPCQPDGGCPFLCEGVGGGNEYARNLCRSFPGNISWWEGRNAFNASQFTPKLIPAEYELEIYIKGVD